MDQPRQTIIQAVVAVEHPLPAATLEITLLEMVALALHPQYLAHPSPMLAAVVVRLTQAREVQQALAARAVLAVAATERGAAKQQLAVRQTLAVAAALQMTQILGLQRVALVLSFFQSQQHDTLAQPQARQLLRQVAQTQF